MDSTLGNCTASPGGRIAMRPPSPRTRPADGCADTEAPLAGPYPADARRPPSAPCSVGAGPTSWTTVPTGQPADGHTPPPKRTNPASRRPQGMGTRWPIPLLSTGKPLRGETPRIIITTLWSCLELDRQFSGSTLWACSELNIRFSGSTLWPCLELIMQFSGSTLWSWLELNLQFSGSTSWPCLILNIRFGGSTLWPCLELNIRFGGSTLWPCLELNMQFSGSTLWSCLTLNRRFSGSTLWPCLELNLQFSGSLCGHGWN